MKGTAQKAETLIEPSLKDSEIRYRRLFEAAQEGILILDAKTGMIEDVNPYLIKTLGYSREEFVEKKLWEIGAFKDIEASQDAFKALQEKEYIRYEDLPLKTKNGGLIQVEFVSNVYWVGGEKVIQCIIRDITVHKRIIVALQENEKKYYDLVNQSPEGVFIIELSGKILTVNKAMCKELAFSEEELLSMSIWELIPEQYLDQYRKRLTKVLEGESLKEEAEYVVRGKDGKNHYVEVLSAPHYSGKDVIDFQGIARDITARKQSEQSLRDSETRFRALIENSSDAIILISSEGKIIYRTPAAYRLMGLDPAALLDNSMFSTIHPDDLKDALKGFAQLLQTPDKSLLFQFRVHHSDGSWRWIEGMGNNLLIEPAVGAIVVNYRDITERKQAEEDIKINNDELSMLFELSHSLAEADKLDDILDLVNRHAVESIHTTFARIALFEDGNYIIRAAYPIRAIGNDFGIGESYPVNSISSSPHILEQNEPMILQASDPGISDEEKKVLLLDLAQSLCLIPLRISDSAPNSENLIGLLMLGETRNEGREPFTPEKMRLARTIGDSAAIAIRRMLLREQTERRLQELVALSEIDLAIISSSDMVFSLGVLLLQVLEQLKVNAADIWRFNPVSQALEFVAGRGFRTPAFEKGKPLHLGEGIIGQAAIERRTIHIPDLTAHNDHPRLTKALAKEPFISYFAVPLIVKGQVKGVLELFHRTELEPNEEWMEFLHALANQAAIAIDNSSLFKDLQDSNTELTQAYDATILGWSRALDLRDNETEGHTQRVTELTTRLGRLFGLSEEELVYARWGALLHDIGKMGVPDGILLKPGPLTDEEWVVMRNHTTFAFELLSPIHFLRTAVDIPYCHHEKWDGLGYPRGLKGEAIPLPARIFALVDVYDALTSDRPYRKAWPEEKVLEHIRSLSGTHFDPQVVKICLEPGLLNGQSKRRMQMEPVQWTEKFSVGVRELDQQHQQLIKLLNRLIATQGTITTHSETISDVLLAMTRYAQVHFKTEERLMEAYGYPGLEEQKMQHRDFRKKTVGFSTATTFGINQVPEDLLTYLTNWLTHHILEDDMAYRSFFKDKGVE